jgi:hypothetical protein
MSKALQLRLGFVFLLSLFFLSLLVKESFGKTDEQSLLYQKWWRLR